MSIPNNKILYNKVKNTAIKKFKVWPSAYASGWLVKEYKRRGGTYKGKKPSKKKGLGRWFEEEWINVCYLPKKIKCGRPKTSLNSWKKNYPYCRPLKRISKGTPVTSKQLSKKEIKKRCSMKKRNPLKRVTRPRKSRRKSRRKKVR